MPQLTLEYSDNLKFDSQKVLALLHERLSATGVIPLKGLKSRAIRHHEWRVADGHEDYAFVHLGMLLREGRSGEAKKQVVDEALAVLEEEFGQRFDEGFLSLTVDMKEMQEGMSITKHNIPAGGVRKEQTEDRP